MSSRYQEWLKHIFDHEDRGHLLPEWYWDENAEKFLAPDAELVELIDQTFRNAGRDLVQFTDWQVGQGIWYLSSVGCSDFILALNSSEVPLIKRVEAVHSIHILYADCFAKRCTETMGHLSEEGSRLNSSCYMFWDNSFLTVGEDQEMQNSILIVLEKILAIEHGACRESALHGLGEMFFSHREESQKIIDGFLSKTKLDEKLLAYARNAREGNVL